MNNVLLGLGSNSGNKKEYISEAIRLLDEANKVSAVSSLYESLPYGFTKQGHFLNLALYLQTNFNLKELLRFVKKTEKQIGRTESFRWGPREIDIDILMYNDLHYSDEEITVPHAEFYKRDFVLLPVYELTEKIDSLKNIFKIRKIDMDSIQKNVIFRLDFNFSVKK